VLVDTVHHHHHHFPRHAINGINDQHHHPNHANTTTTATTFTTTSATATNINTTVTERLYWLVFRVVGRPCAFSPHQFFFWTLTPIPVVAASSRLW